MVTDGSPRSADTVANGGGVSSPPSRRPSLHSPWASVVRGDSEQNSSPTAAAAAAAPRSSSSPPAEEVSVSVSVPDNSLIETPGTETRSESSENNGDSNAGGPRRPAWNRPVNGVVEPVSVMGGAVSWPALSETTRPVARSSSDTSRPVSDGSAPSSQAPIISHPPQRSANSSAHGNHNHNHGNHSNSGANNSNSARLRRNRGGGSSGNGGGGAGSSSGSGQSQSTFNQPSLPMPPPFPVFEVPFGGMIPAIIDNSLRGPRPVGGVGASQSPTGNEHSSQRSNSRRGNYGPRPRGDGQYHNNHGGRRDQDRREVHHAPQYGPPPMGYLPPPLPPGAAPFMAPPPLRVFPGQMGFDMASPFIYVPPMPLDSFRTMPIVPPLAPMIFPPANDNPLTNMIVQQIDFYFSDHNLVKDSYLRSKMDAHGWVPISVVAAFPRVEQLTKDIPLILESLMDSTVVEVQGDKIRRRNEWSKWLLPTVVVNSDSGPGASSSTPENVLATSTLLQGVSLNSTMAHANGTVNASEIHTEMADATQLPVELANGDPAEEVHSNSS